MGKQPIPAFFEISIFVMLLYSAEVSTAPVSPSILSVMNNDSELCSTPRFLYESEATKSCAKLNYPNGDVALNSMKDPDIFLCLGVYDAGYKLCQYSNHWRNPFNNTAAFNSYIEKRTPGGTVPDKDKFCESVKDIKPMYEKIKPFTLWLTNKLNNTFVCHTFCFVFEEKFNPLCAVLAWIKSVDVELETVSTVGQGGTIVSPPVKKINSTLKSQSLSQNKDTEVPGANTTISNNRSSPTEQPNPRVLGNKKELVADSDNLVKVMPDEQKILPKEKPLQSQNDTGQPTVVVQPKAELPKTQNSMSSASGPSLDPGLVESVGDDTASTNKKSETNNNPPISTTKAVKNDTPKEATEDVKTSTISEHTQDGNESNNNDYPMEGERMPFDQVEVDQPTDMSDQNPNIPDPNIPEPSEQRDFLSRLETRESAHDSHFFAYFTVVSMICVAMYIGNHYKQKIIAIVLEGRRSRNNRGRRRPSTASYRKLDCTLEEAVTSQCNANVTHVIY